MPDLFEKIAEVLATVSDPETNERTAPPLLERSMSAAGPQLATLTMESDREKLGMEKTMSHFWSGFEKRASWTVIHPLKTDRAKAEYAKDTMHQGHREGTMAGAVGGGMLGAAMGRSRLKGGVIGAVGGAALGAGLGHFQAKGNVQKANETGVGVTRRRGNVQDALLHVKKYHDLNKEEPKT